MILGGSGMIGHQIYQHLKSFSEYQIVIQHNKNSFFKNSVSIDFFNLIKLKEFILTEKPNFIINCSGILIEDSESDLKKAIYLNAYVPHQVKDLANSFGCKMIQISTDCVFSGQNGPYDENDARDGFSNYSVTKGLGEINDEFNLTLRTSVIGPDLKQNSPELFHWFLNQKDSINGYSQSIWSGVTSFQFAKSLKEFLDSNAIGIHHVASATPISKFKLLHLLENYFNKGIKIQKVDGPISNKSLKCSSKEIQLNIPSYDLMIEELYNKTISNIKYSHYFK
jgi:dTDP-4-dehydrorhamnose reductase